LVLSLARSGKRRLAGISLRAEGIGLADQPGELGEWIALLLVRLERFTAARISGGGVRSVLISLGHGGDALPLEKSCFVSSSKS
jgi:hypothetical protein